MVWYTTVLIDTWWNVNRGTGEDILKHFAVLIDTWWNVNHFEEINKHIVEVVLIDTWWNVNMINNDAWISEEIGFNRYMVECEYFFI